MQSSTCYECYANQPEPWWQSFDFNQRIEPQPYTKAQMHHPSLNDALKAWGEEIGQDETLSNPTE